MNIIKYHEIFCINPYETLIEIVNENFLDRDEIRSNGTLQIFHEKINLQFNSLSYNAYTYQVKSLISKN